MQDPNVELLHWRNVQRLVQTVYKLPLPVTDVTETPTSPDDVIKQVLNVVIFASSPSTAASAINDALETRDLGLQQKLLLGVLLHFVENSGVTTFSRVLQNDSLYTPASNRLKECRRAFYDLRVVHGAIILQDQNLDSYALVSYKTVLAPAILQIAQNNDVTVAKIADTLYLNPAFRKVSLTYIKRAVTMLVSEKLLVL